MDYGYMTGLIICIYIILLIFRRYQFAPDIGMFQHLNYHFNIIVDALVLSVIFILATFCINGFLSK